jgi:demethylspheroidene O-methyltransferase
VVLPETLLRWRNRLLTDHRFLSFAQRFPITRPIARKKSTELFDLLAGFSYSQVLFACVELKLFERIGTAGCKTAKLLEELPLPRQRAEVLLKAAVALRLFEFSGSNIHLGANGTAILAQPWIMRFVEHHKYFYRDLEDPVALLKSESGGEGLRRFWNYKDSSSDKSSYSALMAASQQAVSEQILGAYDFRKHQRILDVGGGSGAFLNAVGAKHQHLECHLFDLPAVAGLADPSIKTHPGDFRTDALPKGMDVITIIRVIHDHDDDVVLTLLRNVRKACEANTTVIIVEPFAGNPSTARVTDAYFNLYFTAMGQGRTRTTAEIIEIAAHAGLGHARQHPTNMPLITGVMSFRQIASQV